VVLEQIVAQYGYAALLLGTLLEGETILIVAGFAAHQGYMELSWVILCAFIGSLTGDQLYFFIGRLKGRPLLQRKPALQIKAAKVENLLARHGTLIMLSFRFMYGLRTITPFIIGTTNVRTKRFLLLNATGALVWALVISCVGFLFGAAAEPVLGHIRKIEKWIVLGIVGAGAIIWLLYFMKKKRQVQQHLSYDGSELKDGEIHGYDKSPKHDTEEDHETRL
jgi:membrane protein DedA with SNARE-associated domain